jgi:hypothetical protein
LYALFPHDLQFNIEIDTDGKLVDSKLMQTKTDIIGNLTQHFVPVSKPIENSKYELLKPKIVPQPIGKLKKRTKAEKAAARMAALAKLNSVQPQTELKPATV